MSTERTYRALLVGNSVFPAEPALPELFGPRNDVPAIAAALGHVEWGLHNLANITTLVDASKSEIEGAMDDFFSGAGNQDQLFFFYSGHGIPEIHDRLFLAARDTRQERLLSTGVAMELLNLLAGTTRAAAIVIGLDCCYSGIMKGPDPALYLDARGRWILTSSRRDQQSKDADNRTQLSAFSELFAEALVANAEADQDADGYVTMADIHHYLARRLLERTGQDAAFRFDGAGELVVALAPGHAIEYELIRPWAVRPDGSRITVPEVPRVSLDLSELAEPGISEQVEVPTAPPASVASYPVLDVLALDDDAFVGAVLDEVEQGHTIRVQRVLAQVTREAVRLVESSDPWEHLAERLDRLACLAVAFAEHNVAEMFERVISSFVLIYEQGFDSRGYTKPVLNTDTGVSPVELWFAILERLVAVGASLVRGQRWALVTMLALQQPDGEDFRYYNNWIRHAITMSARANLFREEIDGRFQEKSLLRVAGIYAQAHTCLVADLARPDSDKLLDSLCQFDFLWCVAALTESGTGDGKDFYPSFARFYGERIAPVARKLINPGELRSAIAPIGDQQLAPLLQRLGEVAANDGIRYSGWHRFSDEVANWISENVHTA